MPSFFAIKTYENDKKRLIKFIIFFFTSIAAIIEKYQGGQLVPLLTEAGAIAK